MQLAYGLGIFSFAGGVGKDLLHTCHLCQHMSIPPGKDSS